MSNTKPPDNLRESLLVPFGFVVLLWCIKIIELNTSLSFTQLGILPRDLWGLGGVLFSPLLHGNARDAIDVMGNFSHLFSNSVPLIVLGFILFQSYRRNAYFAIAFIWLLSGILTWAVARNTGISGGPTYHIGASGVVYGLAFYLFFSGLFRKDTRSIALSLLVVFLYGSMIWGMLPILDHISFEGHIAGAFAGTLAAWLFKTDTQRLIKYTWELEPEENLDNIVEDPFWLPPKPTQNNELEVRYSYRPKKEDQ